MRPRLILATAGMCLHLLASPQLIAQQAYEFVNGHWYVDGSFVERTVFSDRGIFLTSRPGRIDSVINLNGGWVVPPLGEGHIHDLNDAKTLDDRITDYLSKGIHYVLVQDALFPITADILSVTEKTTTPDVVYASGVVLASHSEIATDLYAAFARQGRFGADHTTLESLDGHVLFLIDSKDDLDEKWDRIKTLNADVVKIIIAFADEYDWRMALPDSSTVPRPGLKPELVPLIVERAHASGRRVSAHIETAADFRLAVESGVDIIAHLPGWRIGNAAGYASGQIQPWVLTQADAIKAAEKDVFVVTTTLPKTFLPDWEENLALFNEIHKRNLALLYAAGVTIAIGSDSDNLAPGELLHIAEYGIFDNRVLLDMATRTTPQMIFPNRKLGELRSGYEASFVVLRHNPLTDLEAISDISLQVKQGYIIR